jgi:soluble lytic murein transglycosylase-like protein
VAVRSLFLIFCLSAPLLAGEYAVLQSGFRIHADRHETDGSTVRLLTASGAVEMPSSLIAGFEQEEYSAPKPEPPAAATPVRALTPQELVENAARKHGLRPEFVRSIAAVESNFSTNAVSPKGALGLMQLMPATAAELGADPKNPAQNADAGTRYLRELLDRYKDKPDGIRLAIAAYNAGPGAVDKHGSIPPYRETQTYVDKVVRKYLQQLKTD